MNGYKNKIVLEALQILENELIYKDNIVLSEPDTVKDFVKLKLGLNKNEVFCILFLNSQHKLIKFEELFVGSIACATIYPRTVIEKVLKYNAASVILAHNHPSGSNKASIADKTITDKLIKLLNLIDVQVLDHIIVGDTCSSFAEEGLI